LISSLAAYTTLDFSDDIYFMAALYYNDLLNKNDIYNIANHLTNTIGDDDLIKILVNGEGDDNNIKLFVNYLNKLNIKYLYPKETLTAIVFYYVLQNKINMYSGISFVDRNVRNFEDTMHYIGDDVGIEQILGNYYYIDDGDAIYEEQIKEAEKYLIEELQYYVYYNLPDFDIYDIKTIFKDYIPKDMPYNPHLLHRVMPDLQLKDYDYDIKKHEINIDNDSTIILIPIFIKYRIAFALTEQNDKCSLITFFYSELNKIFDVLCAEMTGDGMDSNTSGLNEYGHTIDDILNYFIPLRHISD
jgi:hypothetical protein